MPQEYCYPFPRPSVTVDVVAFGLRDGRLCVLLIRRGRAPFAERFAFPGGFLDLEETVEAGARRELREETGLSLDGPFEPLGFYGAPDRDPRGRTISLVFAAVTSQVETPRGADDATDADWVPLDQAINLAFDHDAILVDARNWLRRGFEEADLAFMLLPTRFPAATLHELGKQVGLPRRAVSTYLKRLERRERLRASAHDPTQYEKIA